MELGLKLGAIVRLDGENPEWQAPEDLVDELDGCALIAGIVHLEDPTARAIVDGRELIEALVRAWNALEKLHV
jgi:hypothetical protein